MAAQLPNEHNLALTVDAMVADSLVGDCDLVSPRLDESARAMRPYPCFPWIAVYAAAAF
jgi:hypothetical protein